MKKTIGAAHLATVGVAIVIAFFAQASCAHRQHVLGEAAPGDASCKQTSDCPWGYECTASSRCLESECHDDDPKGPLGLKSCSTGTCEYDGDDELAHGNGACTQVPFSQ
jgi:hypothetical protein